MKRRPRGQVTAIFVVVGLSLAAAAFYGLRKGPEGDRRVVGSLPSQIETEKNQLPAVVQPKVAAAPVQTNTLLTVSGYIIARERIEVSPRFQGVVQWIGVRKGDKVAKGQVVVRLDDAEQKARIQETQGRLAAATVALERATIAYRRAHDLFQRNVVAQEADDEARLSVEAAKAQIQEIEGQLALLRTYLDWTVIRSPIDGIVLEKLVEPGEQVVPMSYGGGRGPSTALIAVADLGDLQVEVDLNEADLAKISLGGACRVVPEAYPNLSYDGRVAEIAPEANRQKGTLQIKVQVLKPDRFLTPELTAKVEFLP